MKSGNTPQDEPQIDRESFVFYKSFYNAIVRLPNDLQLEIYSSIVCYGLFGIKPENLSPTADTIFTLIKPQIDANNKRYVNSQKGGSKKGISNNPSGRGRNTRKKKLPTVDKLTTKELPTVDNLTTKELPTVDNLTTKELPNDNVNVNVNVNDNDNVNDNNILTVINNSSSITKLTQQKPAFDFMEFFNSVMKRSNAQIPQIKSLSGNREKFLNARIREYGLDAVKEVVEKAAASDFLNGGGENGWRADCTWILRPNNFPKILEGNFDNHPQQITCYYDKQQQNKQAIIAHQNAAFDRIIEEESRRWQEQQQQLTDGGSVEEVPAEPVF